MPTQLIPVRLRPSVLPPHRRCRAGVVGTTACSPRAPAPAPPGRPRGASSGAAANYGTIALQLSWIKNIEFAGEFFATENGYYKKAGFTGVTLLAGGGSTGRRRS